MLLPCSRFINFVFSLENVTISLREQLVRHKVGMEFWIQGARITDMSNFYNQSEYRIPDRINQNITAKKMYLQTIEKIQDTYQYLLERNHS